MRILVTGGAGFIGSHIVDHLIEEEHQVLVIDNLSTGRADNLPREARLEVVDVASPRTAKLIEAFRPDAITHCAAQPSVIVSMAEPAADAKTNILAGIELFQAAASIGCRRLVYITTGGALYGHPDYTPSDEQHPIRPISAYGLSKWTLEHYARILLGGKVPVATLRLANIYGPRQDPHGEAGVVAIFTLKMLDRQPVTIYGDGEQTRDFVYVGDVVSAHARALAIRGDVTVNISSAVPTSVNTIFHGLAPRADYGAPPHYEPERAGEIREVVLDNTTARERLGWTPEVALDDGLARTVEWFEANRAARRTTA